MLCFSVSIRKVGRLRLAARLLITASRRQIQIIADALLQRGTLSGNEITALLNGATASWLR